MQKITDSLYDILKIKKDASPEEIKEAFRNAAKQNHTDKGGDHDKMTAINKAYAVLKNPESRKRYDETGATDEIPFDKRFKAFVQDIFMKLVEQRDVDHTDLVSEFKIYTDQTIEANERAKSEHEIKLSRLEKVVVRIKHSSGNNQISEVVTMNIDYFKKTIATIESDIEFIKECKEHLEEYSYDFEAQSEVATLFLSGFTFTSGL